MEQKTKILIRMANFFSHKVYYKDNEWLILNEKICRYPNRFFRYLGWIKDLEDSYPNSNVTIKYSFNTMDIKLESLNN